MFRILVINPGSTSTKLAIYEDENEVLNQTVRHKTEEISKYDTITHQYEFRKNVIEEFLNKSGFPLASFSAIIGRGGLLKPIPGGVYKVNDNMIDDLKKAIYGEHASNLGAIIAKELAKSVNIEAFIADPVVVDEMMAVARISGHPDFERKSIFHALNQKAIARQLAEKLGKNYEDMNIIVVHMGGGISIGAHYKGRVVDVNNALDGDGPFTPERSGTLPLTGVLELGFSGKYTLSDMKKLIKGNGGMTSYLNTNDAQIVQKMIKDGDENALLIYKSMAYQISKWIGKISAALDFEIDAIALTGGIAYDDNYINKWIREKVEFLAPIYVFPGGDEELALALSALRALRGVQEIKVY